MSVATSFTVGDSSVRTDERFQGPVSVLNVVRYPIGGIKSYLRYTYSRLDASVFSTTVLAVYDREAELLPPGMAPLKADLQVVPQKHAFLRLLSQTHRLLRTRRYDLVHSQGATAALASALSARWFRVPHVVTLHETFRDEQFVGVRGWLKRRIIAFLFGLPEAIVALGQDARANLIHHIPFGRKTLERIEVIRNGVDVDRLVREVHTTGPGLREKGNIASDVTLLGFIGRFMPEKGFDIVLDAVRLLQHKKATLPKFTVVAVNDGAFMRDYRRQISAAGLDSSFHFVGLQPSAAGTLGELDAVLMPSRREACPLVAMEALVLGCPLIASDCIGLREVTSGTPALRTSSGDPESLALAIEQFLRDRVAHRTRAEEFAPTARNAFDAAHTARKLTDLFRRVLSRNGEATHRGSVS